MKIYRKPKIKDGQIKVQRGKIDGDVDMCVFYADNIPSCDRRLIMNALGGERAHARVSNNGKLSVEFAPSLIDELEARGYDLDTLKFSIDKKAASCE